MSLRIVVLDGYALNPGDLSWSALEAMGEVQIYDRTVAKEILERSRGAQVLLTNKTPLRADVLAELPELQYIGVIATGFDVIDTKAARERGIDVCNAPSYGTDSVAQLVFALLLEICHRVQNHSDSARSGEWAKNPDYSYHLSPLTELAGQTMGIVGFGRIGERTASIARAFGMKVLTVAGRRSGKGVEQASVEELFSRSDVISLHSPLTPETKGMVNRDLLGRMKPSGILINTSRGGLIVEADLADALNGGELAAAAVDVLTMEPPRDGSPLLSARNCLVTPHIAWATREARQRLLETTASNLRGWIAGNPTNVVNR